MFPICELFKIRYPLIQGGMGNISHAALTAAVSKCRGTRNARVRDIVGR